MTNAENAPALSGSLNFKLSLMMFLQYAIWGAWLPVLYPYLKYHLGFELAEIGNIFAVGAVGALIAPLIAGQIADRYFSTERFLGLSHIVGGLLVWQLARFDTYGAFIVFSLIYSLIYAPTLSLTNSLAFHHLPDRDRDFGRVRAWGTIGWIAVGIAIGQWILFNHTPGEGTKEQIDAAQDAGFADAFRISGGLGVLMGVYCFVLPRTPPSKGAMAFAPMEALAEIRKRPLLVLFLLAVPVSCIHQFYFVHTADFLGELQESKVADFINSIFGVNGGGLMTIGQMSEIAVLALIPLVAKKWSRKTLLAIGLIAYALRMAIFAFIGSMFGAETETTLSLVHTALLMMGIAMHGFCFGCFIFVAFMIVDENTTGDVRATAQSLFNVVIVGIGIIVGSKVAVGVAAWATENEIVNFQKLFSVPMWASLVCLVALLLLYPRRAASQHVNS